MVPQPVPHPPVGSSRTTIAVGLGILAVFVIGVAVAIAARSRHHTETTDNVEKETPGHDKHGKDVFTDDDGENVPVTGPGSSHEPDKWDQSVPQPPGDRQAFCTNVCQIARGCGVEPPNCMDACIFNETSVACAAQVGKMGGGTCNDFAACVFQVSCNALPLGTMTCLQTAQCQGACKDSALCSCRCASGMALQHAHALLALDNCVITCGNDPACIQQRCTALAAACRAE
jgi:hypothetical protein